MESIADSFGLSFRNFAYVALLASDFFLKKLLALPSHLWSGGL